MKMRFFQPLRPGQIVAGFLVLLLSACNLPATPAETPTAGPFPIPTVELLEEQPTAEATLDTLPEVTAIEPTQAETAAAEPPADETAAAPAAQPDILYEGISFSYPDDLAGSVDAQTIPAQTDENTVPPWDLLPEHYVFTFNNYVLQDTFHTPRIYVYPVEGLQQVSLNGADVVSRLEQLLQAQPPAPEVGLPFLPPFNAAQIMAAKIDYVDFQNGQGVRFLTEYGQAIRLINNNELFYTYQGLTADGRYYIAAVFPTQNIVLPETGDQTLEEYQAMEALYEQYLNETTELLNGQPDSSYMPGIDVLDAIMQSVRIDK
jgi:hypothetical protein